MALNGPQTAAQPPSALSGMLGVTFLDHLTAPERTTQLFALHTFDGRTIPLKIPDEVLAAAGGLFAVQRQPVEVIPDGPLSADGTLTAGAIQPAAAPRWFDVDPVGTIPWTVLLCKFGDQVGYTPFTQAAAQTMFGAAPGLAGYWSITSHGKTTISATVEDWEILPKTLTQYKALDFGTRMEAIFADCIAAHGIPNNSSPYNIVIEFNGDAFDGYSIGGYRYAGSSLQRRVWHSISPGGGFTESLIAHEIGHTYGLPHSNNNDGLPGDPYDNAWDVMSWSYEGVWDETYGHHPPPTNGYHYQQMGMIPAGDRMMLASGTRSTVIIDRWGVVATPNVYLVTIPIPGDSRFYTIETRKMSAGGYEENVIGDGVLVYQIDNFRPEPAWMVLDTTSTPFVFDPTLALTPGEIFGDQPNKVYVYVESETADGYVVRVAQGIPLFEATVISPAAASSVTNAATTFTWQPIANATRYKLRLLSTTGMESLILNLTGPICTAICEFSFDPAAHGWTWREGETYKWSIEGKSSDGIQLAKSPKIPFTFDALPPAIALTSPSDPAVVPPGMVTFEWGDDPRFSEYRVVIIDSSGLKLHKQWQPRTALCTPDCSFGFTLAASPTPYRWRVEGRTANVTGKVKSETRSITVGAP